MSMFYALTLECDFESAARAAFSLARWQASRNRFWFAMRFGNATSSG